MKVKELIERLSKCNPEAKVYFEKEVITGNWDENGCFTDIDYESYDIETVIESKIDNVVSLY